MLEGIIHSKSKTFLTFCFCFLLGVAIGSFINRRLDFVYLYLSLFIIVASLLAAWRHKTARFFIFALVFVWFGFARYSFALPPPDVAIPTGEQTFTAVVAAEPDVRIDGVRYILEMSNFRPELKSRDEQLAMNNTPVSGRVYMKSFLYPRYQYGDVLKITCPLERPEPFDGFRYDMYLARLRVFLICQNPTIDMIESGQGSGVVRLLLAAKQRFALQVNQLWHEPCASFMAGLLYGYRGGLGSLSEQFNRTGVSHILAISGYNIAIIANLLIIFCVRLWIPRKKAFWLVSTGIVLFVLFTGASGSVVRAGIMGWLVILAQQVGRLNRPTNAMAATAVLMTLHNPFILIWDVGFQLSFLAMIGLVYLSPILKKKTERLPEFLNIKETALTTVSAILMTLPLMLYQFGQLSLVAPLVNILILWIIPWIMATGFLSVLTSWIFFPFGQWIAWLTWVGMRYVVVVVQWFAAWSLSAVPLPIPSWLMMVAYGVLFFMLWRSSQPRKYVSTAEGAGR